MKLATALIDQLNKIILGKSEQVELAVACLISGGHFIIEDRPGVGKTTFVKALGSLAGLQISRIQFTNDLLPADILGVTLYNSDSRKFSLKKGPIFAQFIIADEINRGSPKTQSAFLQAMEEHQVSIDGEVHGLPSPFLVVATQNPVDLNGTFPLPDSQLDRFSAVIRMGYPNQQSEKQLIQQPLAESKIPPICDSQQLKELSTEIGQIDATDAIVDYIYRLVEKTRLHPDCEGLSTRGGQSLLKIAKAVALIHDRTYVIPEDVQSCFVDCSAHRLFVHSGDGRNIAEQILSETRV